MRLIFSKINHFEPTPNPAGIYLLKVNNRNTRTSVKYVQS